MIVYCCSDLIFATKIAVTARAAGIPTRPARDADALANRLQCVDDGRANDPVTGVVVDLDHDDALTLITVAKSFDAALTVIAFGSHVAVDRLEAARKGGADTVLPRSRFSAELPQWLDRLDQT